MLNLSDEFSRYFLDASNPFRESVTYTKTGGAAVSIYGIVRRGGMEKVSGKDKTPVTYDYELIIACDTTSGIDTVTTGMDKVVFTLSETGTSNTFIVAGIVAKTGMCWHLGLRA